MKLMCMLMLQMELVSSQPTSTSMQPFKVLSILITDRVILGEFRLDYGLNLGC